MTSIFDRIKKRSALAFDADGVVLHVAELTHGEASRVRQQEGERSNKLTMILCLVNADGSKVFPAGEGETDEALIDRLANEIDGIPDRITNDLAAAYLKLAKPVDMEKLAKN